MKTNYTLARDTNGNRTLRIKEGDARARSIQTNGNLPRTHLDGVGDWTPGEVEAYRAATAPKPSRHFINRLGQGYRETVDEFDTRKEARAMLAEYRMADPTAHHYLSSRACKGWDDEAPPAAFDTNGGTFKANPRPRAPLNLAHPGQ
jgi:hypothetical protein